MTNTGKITALLFIAAVFGLPAHALDVVVTIKPLHSLVQSILGDSGQARLLLDNSASPHDVQLKPSDVRLLNRADTVFLIDRKFEGFMERFIKSAPAELNIVELAQDSALKRLPVRQHDRTHRAGKHHADFDPHIWLNPENAKIMVGIIAGWLARLDGANADLYQMNLVKTLEKLDLLDNDLNARLSGLKHSAFITQHDAFQYFEARYELKFIRAIALDSSVPGSIKLAMEIQNSIESNNVTCIFHEPQYSDRLVRRLADSAGIKTGMLDPIGINLNPGPELYFDLMENIGNNFLQCMSDRT